MMFEVISMKSNSSISPKEALEELYKKGICTALLEGGGQLISSFFREECVDEMLLFVSGKVIGSPFAPSWCSDLGIPLLKNVPEGKIQKVKTIGKDLLIRVFF